MKRTISLAIAAMLLVGCASYRQLKPEPELSPAEQGYIELKENNKKKDFELKKNKKYFVAFPASQSDNFYLALTVADKDKFNSSFTAKLVKKKIVGEKIRDESPTAKTMSVYPVESGVPGYYWLIDHVQQDMPLKMTYRYVPRWRFKFEVKSADLKVRMARNVVDRSAYKGIGTVPVFNGFDFSLAIDTVTKHLNDLNKVHDECVSLAKIFPQQVIGSQDAAFVDYAVLKTNLEDEIAFQTAYLLALDFFGREIKSRENPSAFLDNIENFIKYFSQKALLAENVVKESQSAVTKDLAALLPSFELKLSGKEDGRPLDAERYRLAAFGRIGTLYETAGLVTPQEFVDLIKFVNAFQARSTQLVALRDSLGQATKRVKDLSQWPSDDFFGGIVAKTSAIASAVPQLMGPEFGKYASYTCTGKLNEDITDFGGAVRKQDAAYREADAVVPQLNMLKAQQNYRSMLVVFKQKTHLDFLLEKYKTLDRMYVDQQAANISSSLRSFAWAQAEAGLTQLHADTNFLNPMVTVPAKELVVRNFEDSLYTSIDRLSRSRVNKFLEEKLNVLENVDSLYTDSVFLPAYNVTFSSGSKKELIQHKNELIADLAKMKENEFPAKAIKLLYEQFVKNPDDNGVLKARAIVTHGEHYKGEDKETKARVAECNPNASKWITKPTEYRRVYVMPVTSKQRGKNKYYFRLNINIPTDAKFPVYDVNIKLPQQVAQNAATEQWYDQITLNKKPLKNEGRFSIGAPTASNNYECQITPMQMTKDENNYLDVTFSYDAFKVFIVSVMVQKPIIKKN